MESWSHWHPRPPLMWTGFSFRRSWGANFREEQTPLSAKWAVSARRAGGCKRSASRPREEVKLLEEGSIGGKSVNKCINLDYPPRLYPCSTTPNIFIHAQRRRDSRIGGRSWSCCE